MIGKGYGAISALFKIDRKIPLDKDWCVCYSVQVAKNGWTCESEDQDKRETKHGEKDTIPSPARVAKATLVFCLAKTVR